MMVDQKTIDFFYKQNLETSLVTILSARLNIPLADAMNAYYTSRSAELIEKGDYGYADRSPEYLVDEMLSNEPNHFSP